MAYSPISVRVEARTLLAFICLVSNIHFIKSSRGGHFGKFDDRIIGGAFWSMTPGQVLGLRIVLFQFFSRPSSALFSWSST